MKPKDDWMELEIEEKKKSEGLVLPDSVRDKSIVEVGDIFIAKVLGPDVGDRIKVGDRCLFYGLGTVQGLKLPSGRKIWVGRAQDVCFVLEKGD